MTAYRRASPATWTIVLLTLGSNLVGCASFRGTKAEEGAAVGAAGGAVVGAVIGAAKGSTAKGAILGAVIGGAAGAIIGSQMDEQAEILEEELENATVERVGEGIQVTFESGILFGFDSDALRPEARENLNSLQASLSANAGTEVLIAGHTDATGDDSYNLRLSEQRAAAAAQYLVGRGLERSRIKTIGLGEGEPVAENESEMGRSANRRVEVAIFASEAMRAEMARRHGG